MSINLGELKLANALRWGRMRVLTQWAGGVEAVSVRLAAARARYEVVAQTTGVPWTVIAVIHERESSQSWRANLAQGDPWNTVSVHVPRNRGPFNSWEDAAVDALTHCAPFAASWKDWSIGGLLTLLEQYNGLGYAMRDRPSPYLWAGTDQYHSGKFVADDHFDPDAIDHQLGCAGLLQALGEKGAGAV